MFNPQRRSKINDIFMQQKTYQMHVNKIRQITKSLSPQKQRGRQEQQQERYLKRLSMSKRQVEQRLTNNIRKSNFNLFAKLLDTDNRKQQNPEVDYFKNRKRHFNSYFSSKKEMSRIKLQNYTLVTRMLNLSSEVPTLNECQRDFKKSKRFQKKCRKLPAIVQHENQYRERFSRKYLFENNQLAKKTVKTSRYSHLKLTGTNTEDNQNNMISKESSGSSIINDAVQVQK